MNNASSRWDYSNNATKWGFKINTFKMTQFNTVFGHFSTSTFAMTSGTKSPLILLPWNRQQNWLHQPQEEEAVVYFMIVFHSTSIVEKLNEYRNYNEFCSHEVFKQFYSLCPNLMHKFRFYKHFLHTNLWRIWNSGDPNAKCSTQCCPSLEGICGAPWSPGCGHWSFQYKSPIISPGFLAQGAKDTEVRLSDAACRAVIVVPHNRKQKTFAGPIDTISLCWRVNMNLLHWHLMGQESPDSCHSCHALVIQHAGIQLRKATGAKRRVGRYILFAPSLL